MSTRSRGGAVQKSAAETSPTTTPKRGNVELFMECVDEDLAPSQKEAERIAETEYRTAVQRVKTARSAATVDTVSNQTVTKSTVSASSARPTTAAKTTTVAIATTGHTVSVTPGRGRGRGRPRGRGRGSNSVALAHGRGTKNTPALGKY